MFCIGVKIELWARWVNSLPLSVASWMYDYHKSQFTVMSYVDFKRLVWIHSSLLWVKTITWIHPPRNYSYITGKKEFLTGLQGHTVRRAVVACYLQDYRKALSDFSASPWPLFSRTRLESMIKELSSLPALRSNKVCGSFSVPNHPTVLLTKHQPRTSIGNFLKKNGKPMSGRSLGQRMFLPILLIITQKAINVYQWVYSWTSM